MADRLAEVQGAGRLLEDLVRVPQVGVEVRGDALRAAGQQRAGVRQHQRVVVDVDDAALRRDGLGHLVGVAGRGQPGAEVEELPDARLGGQVAHAAGEEGPVGPGGSTDGGVGGDGLLAGDPVGLELSFPPSQ